MVLQGATFKNSNLRIHLGCEFYMEKKQKQILKNTEKIPNLKCRLSLFH